MTTLSPEQVKESVEEAATTFEDDCCGCGSEHHQHNSLAYSDSDEHYYVTEEGNYLRAVPKLGRNDPCYCGSGKKFKKCCAAKN